VLRNWHIVALAALSKSSALLIGFLRKWLLWLSNVSFADFAAAGKQPAEYPDPELIQVVDKNEHVYLSAALKQGV
jgi:hypothetical protein